MPFLCSLSTPMGGGVTDAWIADLWQEGFLLEELTLSGDGFTGLGLGNLSTLKSLEVLFSVDFSDQGLAQVSGLPLLERLELSSCHSLTSAGHVVLRSASRLRHLMLSGCDQVQTSLWTQILPCCKTYFGPFVTDVFSDWAVFA